MSIGTSALRGGLAAGLTLVAAIAALSAGQAARKPSTAERVPLAATSHAGPVAISMRRPGEAVVLQSDGRVFALDTARGSIAAPVYRVPYEYQAVDIAAGVAGSGPVVCLTLNKSSAKDYGSFVLQILPDRREVWSYLTGGVYVGIAVDQAAGQAYVGNSTNNAIYRVPIGVQGARAQQVALLSAAERIGALALDAAGRRLFVSDMGAERVFVVGLGGPSRVKAIDLEGIEEVRALAWGAPMQRLYVADSGQETIWAIDPEMPRPERVLRDRRMREPAGLAVADDGTLWVADELARAVFQVSVTDRTILRTVRWEPSSK